MFENNEDDDIIQQLEYLKNYPRMFHEEEDNLINNHVSIQEIKYTLLQFARDKSPGPDGWTTKKEPPIINSLIRIFDSL